MKTVIGYLISFVCGISLALAIVLFFYLASGEAAREDEPD